MGIALVIHNPRSGGRRLEEGEAKAAARRAGMEPLYFELEDNRWVENLGEARRLIVAGGDGTIAQVIREQMRVQPNRPLLPLQILPLGMSNNIYESLRLWAKLLLGHSGESRPGALFDVPIGRMRIQGREYPFLEGMGWGLVAELIHSAHQFPLVSSLPEARRREAWQRLIGLNSPDPKSWIKIRADGTDYSGDHALVEILSLPLIGPRLALAPGADPRQGCLYLVCIPEREKDRFLHCLKGQLMGRKPVYLPKVRAFRMATLEWGPQWMHQDDRPQYYDQPVRADISLWPGRIPFVLP